MKTKLVLSRFSLTVSSIVLLTFGLSAHGQVPATGGNADIVRMIQGGLPESVIVNKIRTSTGQLDTSVDALLALKKAGATDAELTAMTAPMPVVSQPQPAQLASQPIDAMGGQLMRTRPGDPYLVFQSTEAGYFPDGRPNNTAFLVLYEGAPAVLIPSAMVMNFGCFPGNLIVTQEYIFFDPYVSGCGSEKNAYAFAAEEITKKGKVVYRLPFRFSHEALNGGNTAGDKTYGRGIHLNEKFAFGEESGSDAFFTVGVYPFQQSGGWTTNGTDTTAMRSPAMVSFFRDLIGDFKGTIDRFETAAGISNPSLQLSPAARYQVTGDALRQRYREILQQRLDERKSGGNGWLALAQGISTTQQMTSGLMNSAVGMSTGNASQFGSGLQAMATASGGSTYANTASGLSSPQTTASSNNEVQAEKNSQRTNINPTGQTVAAGGIMYNGPNSEWVRMVLATAGPYSCTPAGKVKVPATTSCQRDEEIYKAQALAWGSECSEQTGFHDDAVKIASTLVQTLQSAKRLCGAQAPTGAVHCDTDRILSCSQLPN